MPEKTPEPKSFYTIDGMPRNIPVAFAEEKKEEVKITDGELQKTDLGEIADWLDVYNKQFNFGTLAAKIAMRGKKGESPVSDFETEKEVSLHEIKKRNNDILSKTGLSLEPVRAAGVVISEEGAEYPSEFRINLFDGIRFVKYLRSLKGGGLTTSQCSGLKKAALSMVSQLKWQYDLEDAEDVNGYLNCLEAPVGLFPSMN